MGFSIRIIEGEELNLREAIKLSAIARDCFIVNSGRVNSTTLSWALLEHSPAQL